MDPTTTCCPNMACPARGHTGQGTIGIHSCKDKRFLCTECHKTCSATQGTAFYRLRTSAETVSLVVTLLAHGCPLHAIVVALGYDERTVAGWVARAGAQGQAVQEHLVEPPRDLGQVQADEIRVKKQGGIVWMALAMMVRTRVWLGGEVSEQRDMPLIRRLIERVRRCATHRPLLVCPDGVVSSIRAMRETLRDPVHTGTGGRFRMALPARGTGRGWAGVSLCSQSPHQLLESEHGEVSRFIGQQVGGMAQLKGLKIAHVYHDSDYGRETLPILDTQAAQYGFAVQHLAVPPPGARPAGHVAAGQGRPSPTGSSCGAQAAS